LDQEINLLRKLKHGFHQTNRHANPVLGMAHVLLENQRGTFVYSTCTAISQSQGWKLMVDEYNH